MSTLYRDFQGKQIGVDTSIIMYRLAYVYRAQLNRGKIDVAVECFQRRVDQGFKAGGAEPVCIFDGAYLPGKGDEHQRRRERKCKAVARALGLGGEEALLKAQVIVTEELVATIQARCVRLHWGYSADCSPT